MWVELCCFDYLSVVTGYSAVRLYILCAAVAISIADSTER
jgi:hypothetical protein